MMDCVGFAKEWEESWNSHDLTRIMRHYQDDIVFRSRKALPLIGTGEVCGKEKLTAYWAVALEHQPDLRFAIQDVFESHDMMTVTYTNHRGVLATETFFFDSDGMVYQTAACHRSTPT